MSERRKVGLLFVRALSIAAVALLPLIINWVKSYKMAGPLDGVLDAVLLVKVLLLISKVTVLIPSLLFSEASAIAPPEPALF